MRALPGAPRLLAVCSFVVLAGTGCSLLLGERERVEVAAATVTTPPPPLGTPPPPRGGPPPPGRGGQLSVEQFNALSARADAPWAHSPLLSAVEYLGLGGSEPIGKTTVVITGGSEGGPNATVTVTLDGVLDDSVQAVRWELRFARRDDATWRLLSVERTQRCVEGRGHTDFTAAPCV